MTITDGALSKLHGAKAQEGNGIQADVQAVWVVGESNEAVHTVCEGGDLHEQQGFVRALNASMRLHLTTSETENQTSCSAYHTGARSESMPQPVNIEISLLK